MTVRDHAFYDNYRQRLIQCGVSEEESNRIVDDNLEEASCIDNGICPKCKNLLTRKLDDRQAGPTSVSGKWFNYRCGCGFLCDRVE